MIPNGGPPVLVGAAAAKTTDQGETKLVDPRGAAGGSGSGSRSGAARSIVDSGEVERLRSQVRGGASLTAPLSAHTSHTGLAAAHQVERLQAQLRSKDEELTDQQASLACSEAELAQRAKEQVFLLLLHPRQLACQLQTRVTLGSHFCAGRAVGVAERFQGR